MKVFQDTIHSRFAERKCCFGHNCRVARLLWHHSTPVLFCAQVNAHIASLVPEEPKTFSVFIAHQRLMTAMISTCQECDKENSHLGMPPLSALLLSTNRVETYSK
jgi:hypothetical protein